MKKLLTFIAFLLISAGIAAQTAEDLVFIDDHNRDLELLKSRNAGKPNVFFSNVPQTPAVEEIGAALKSREVRNLHIHVETKPGSMIFANMALTLDTAHDYVDELSRWGQHVKGRVIVHSGVVFATHEGQAFQKKLEELTGLRFVMQ